MPISVGIPRSKHGAQLDLHVKQVLQPAELAARRIVLRMNTCLFDTAFIERNEVVSELLTERDSVAQRSMSTCL